MQYASYSPCVTSWSLTQRRGIVTVRPAMNTDESFIAPVMVAPFTNTPDVAGVSSLSSLPLLPLRHSLWL